MLFLSYAEKDREAVRQVAAFLREHGIDSYSWQDRRVGRSIEEVERAISQADTFIAFVSPNFLVSAWCRMERELAIQREKDLRATHPDLTFIYVLKIADTPYTESGSLRSYDWLDLTRSSNKAEVLDALVSRLALRDRGVSAEVGTAGHSVSLFRNRREELDRVLHGLTNVSGPHFWLVMAPPQLGKTWFLDRLSVKITGEGQGAAHWVTNLVDLREQPAGLRDDANALLAQLFRSLIGDGLATPRNIAREIFRSGNSYLCLLDSAELLADEIVISLRARLGSIYHYVQDAGNSNVRLAVVVATRREKEWRGVAPDPRFSACSLTEFRIDIVQNSLRDLADEMGRTFGLADFRLNAKRIYGLSEGLPALLIPCLQWIRREEWLDPERLETEELFAEIAHPYIRERLLSQDSLYPQANDGLHGRRRGQRGDPLHALEAAFRLLAPYRLFTQSHLRHHVVSDPDFAEALAELRWSVEDLWSAISDSTLLRRPLDEPWQEIQPAIRRLLYRYFYKSDEQRALAHREARKFVEVWTDSQAGKEQVIGLLESLWHEACEYRLSQVADMAERLSESAAALSLSLRPSEAYTVSELRAFAAQRVRNDEEFQQTVDNIGGLFNRLVSIILAPSAEQ